jgi:hypothetical protein
MDLLDQTDSRISVATEDLARRITRRQAVVRFVKGVAGATAALSVGRLAMASGASAAGLCNWANGHQCSGCPSQAACPSGYVICKHGTDRYCGGTSVCPYPSGNWVSISCGRCGMGYYVCTDCRPSGNPDCGSVCTCLSGCICSGCCSRAEVKREFARIGLAPV